MATGCIHIRCVRTLTASRRVVRGQAHEKNTRIPTLHTPHTYSTHTHQCRFILIQSQQTTENSDRTCVTITTATTHAYYISIVLTSCEARQQIPDYREKTGNKELRARTLHASTPLGIHPHLAVINRHPDPLLGW